MLGVGAACEALKYKSHLLEVWERQQSAYHADDLQVKVASTLMSANPRFSAISVGFAATWPL